MGRRYRDVMLDLLDAVVGGEYPERDRMPNETELRERFGASRGVLREALLALEQRGLITVASGRGQVVRPYEDWDTRSPDVLVACIVRGPDPGVLAQAIDARAAVERVAATHATRAGRASDLNLLVGYVDELDRMLVDGAVPRGPGMDAFVVAEAWFHTALAGLSDNPVLAKLSEPLHAPLADLRRRRAPERDRAVVTAHRRILEGLSSREPELAENAVDAYARALRRWMPPRR